MNTNSNEKRITNTGVYLKQEFTSYIKWKSLPTFLRGQPEPVLIKMGINDPEVFELLKIKTQTEFAEKYGVRDLGTLTDWNKRIVEEGLLEDIYGWARQLTPNVVLALYKNVTKNGRAHEVRAWFELIENN